MAAAGDARPTGIVVPNLLKRKLKEGRHVFGLMNADSPLASTMQILSNCGYDCVILDNEHGLFDFKTLSDQSCAARKLGLTPIVRIPDPLSYTEIAKTLDGGAQGIMYPRIETAEQVRQIIQLSKYPPMGRRGNAQGRAFLDWKSGNSVDVMREHNEETLVVIQIETKEAMENLDEILAVPGVDIALVGPNDLSISLGVPGELNGTVVRAAITRVIERCRVHGVVASIHMNDAQTAAAWGAAGMQLVSVQSEAGILQQAGTAMVKQLTAEVKGSKL